MANDQSALPPSPDDALHDLRELVNATPSEKDASDVHIRAGALFARLKALNRAANSATRNHKQATADARHDMDQTHLGLQNLQYEKRHLEREIEKCRQFAYAHSLVLLFSDPRTFPRHSSIYQDIPMYTIDEFVVRAPPEAHSQDVMSNHHQLMLNRLSFELVERQRSVASNVPE